MTSFLVKLICYPCSAEFSLTHVDEVIDELLTTDYSCDIALPRVKKRYHLGFSFSERFYTLFTIKLFLRC